MTTIAKVLIAAVLVGGVGGGVAIAQASDGRDDPVGEVRGPCDEPEDANDPRCSGAAATRVERGEDRPRANDDRRHRRGHRGEHHGRSGRSGRSGRR